MTKILLHGLESSSKGTKATYLRQEFPGLLAPDFKGDLPERMAKLEEILAGQAELVMAGSSFGGLMAVLFALENESRVKKLILLAPALNFFDWSAYPQRLIEIPAWLYIGTHDNVTPIRSVEPLARKLLKNLTFNEVEDDHLLHKNFYKIPWAELLH